MKTAGQTRSCEQPELQPLPLFIDFRGGEPGRGCFRRDMGTSAFGRIRLSENNPLYFFDKYRAVIHELGEKASTQGTSSPWPSPPRCALEEREKMLEFHKGVFLGHPLPGERAGVRESDHYQTFTHKTRLARQRGFSLIELLVVIGIIGLLAATILPSLASARQKAEINRARLEMKAIEVALTDYFANYSRYPTPSNVVSGDFTYGNNEVGTVIGEFRANNSALMAVLLAEDRFCNAGHALNPQKKRFLDVARTSSTNLPGIGADLVYRDPWGNPYIITLDFNYDSRVRDSFYRKADVSADPANPESGLVGLTPRRENPGDRDCYELGGPVMIWSFGPDGKVDPNQSATKSGGVNKDNVLNWHK